MEKLYAVTLLLVLSTFSGAQLESSVERPCPRETVTFTCTVPSLAHVWEVPFLTNISRTLVPTNQQQSIPPFQFSVTAVMTGSITSTATVIATTELNGTLVLCRDGLGMLPDNQNRTINLRDPPTAPETPSVSFPTPQQQFSISWNELPLSMGETVDTYFVNVSGPDDLCGDVNTLQRVTERSYMCSGWTMPAGQKYTFTVAAANCGGGLSGPESDPATVCLQAPNPPVLAITPLYNCSGPLVEIESQARERSPVTIADGINGSPTAYIFSYNGSPISISTGSTPQCSSSSCQHTFRVSSSQVQQYNVSVAASNVVGVGAASTPRIVGLTNNFFNVSINVGMREVTCQFLNGPITSASCEIRYGTDSSYMNLDNTMSANGTNVNAVTIQLGQLQPNTEYYYVVSAMGDSMQARIQCNFRTACVSQDLGGTTPGDSSACSASQDNVNIGNGTACYDASLQTGSTATYICSFGFTLQGNTRRVCLPDGSWSGTTPECLCTVPPSPVTLTAPLTLIRDNCTELEYDCPGFSQDVVGSRILRYSSTDGWPTENLPSCGVSAGVIGLSVSLVVLTVVVAIAIMIAIVVYFLIKKKKVSLNFPHSGHKDEAIKLEEKSPDKTPPPAEETDSAPAPIVYADPNTIPREEHPTTGDVYTMPDKSKKTHKPEDHLPTYQDPGAISHEAAPTGELYTIPDKKPKKGAKKKQPQASRPSEEQLAEMYSQPDKSRKQQSQGLNYADVGFNAPSSGKVPEKPPEVFYSDVKNV